MVLGYGTMQRCLSSSALAVFESTWTNLHLELLAVSQMPGPKGIQGYIGRDHETIRDTHPLPETGPAVRLVLSVNAIPKQNVCARMFAIHNPWDCALTPNL